MALGIHKHIIDFSIIDTNIKTFVFLDESDYMESPDKPFLEIVIPGYTKYIRVPITPNKVNVFTSNAFFNKKGEATDLIDGVYQLRYSIAPHDYIYKDKYYLRTISLQKKYEKLLLSLNLGDCFTKDIKKQEETLVNFNILLQAAKANAEDGSLNKATELYKKAEKLLDNNLNKCK